MLPQFYIVPRNAEQLRWAVRKDLQAVYQARVRRLPTSLQWRFVIVIKAWGGSTRYWKTR